MVAELKVVALNLVDVITTSTTTGGNNDLPEDR